MIDDKKLKEAEARAKQYIKSGMMKKANGEHLLMKQGQKS